MNADYFFVFRPQGHECIEITTGNGSVEGCFYFVGTSIELFLGGHLRVSGVGNIGINALGLVRLDQCALSTVPGASV